MALRRLHNRGLKGSLERRPNSHRGSRLEKEKKRGILYLAGNRPTTRRPCLVSKETVVFTYAQNPQHGQTPFLLLLAVLTTHYCTIESSYMPEIHSQRGINVFCDTVVTLLHEPKPSAQECFCPERHASQ